MPQDGESATDVRQRHRNMPVEPPRPNERLVERLWEVRCADQNDTFSPSEAVQLDEELVEGCASHKQNQPGASQG